MVRSLLKGILFAGMFAVCAFSQAQDSHFSQYNSSPLFLNPAMAGLSNGDYRVYGNFKSQWPTVASSNTYRTFAAGADMAIGKVTKYNSYAGIGVSFLGDQSGSIHLNTDVASISVAYHFMLDKHGDHQLSAALKGSLNVRSIDPSLATFDSQYNGNTGTVDPNGQRESFGRTKIIYGDAGAGLLYSGMVKGGVNIYLGFAIDHVNQPMISFYPSGQDVAGLGGERLYIKETIHGGAGIPVGGRLTIIPNFLILVQGPSQEYDLGCDFKTALGNDARTSTTALHLGVQYRGVYDAIIPSARVDVKGFSLGVSYDINLSKLAPASNTVGGPEVAITYVVATKKKPRPGHCPVMF